VDDLGLAPGALHALWTLDGLGAIGADTQARDAVRAALHHPAASLRRAALMTLPRDAALADAIVGGGLQDADAGVRLEALLVLSELPVASRVATVLTDTLFDPANAADAWMPDAVAIAGAKHGRALLQEVLTRKAPNERAEVATGIAAAARILTRHHAASADVALATALIETAAGADSARATAVLTGLAEGWPDERPPVLTSQQRATLTTAAARMPADARPLLVKVSERWGLPDVFTTP
jgi:hypothetical protein